MNTKINTLYNYYIKIKQKSKQEIIKYFLLENSMAHLMNSLKTFYVFSIGFDEIYHEAKNPRRFKVCVVVCAYILVVTLFQLLLISSHDLYSKFYGTFIPDQFRAIHLLTIILFLMVVGMKIDIHLGEFKYNLSQFKVLYYLMDNWRFKHKLTNENYNKLAIFSRLIQTIFLDQIGPVNAILSGIILVSIAVCSGQLFWISQVIILLPVYVLAAFTASASNCVIYIVFTYYKMLFDQINGKIKSTLPIGRMRFIDKRRERLLINLILQHNQIALEIDNINMVFRRTGASIFISFSLIKIISLYVMLHTKDPLMRMLAIGLFVYFFVFGFGLTYLLSVQIKSAHQSLSTIHKIVCKYRISFGFKLKVNTVFK